MTLFGALVASAPAFSSALHGRVSLAEALGRFLLIFAALWIVCSIAMALLTRLTPTMSADSALMPEMVPGSAVGDR
jgi:preprotein translocase subunit SecG